MVMPMRILQIWTYLLDFLVEAKQEASFWLGDAVSAELTMEIVVDEVREKLGKGQRGGTVKLRRYATSPSLNHKML